MSDIDKLYRLLCDTISDMDDIKDWNDFSRGLRMGYLQVVGIINSMKQNKLID